MLHVDGLKKVEKYLREHFRPQPETTLVLVAVHEEETESANALKLMQSLQKEQEAFHHLPKYERDAYKKPKGRFPIEDLCFDREELLVMEGSALLNFPL